jgi:hypothetical protein
MSQRCQWCHCACHSGVNYIALHITAESMTPLCNQLCQIFSRMIWNTFCGLLTLLWHEQRYHCHRSNMYSGVNDNAVTWTLVTPLCKYDTAVTLNFIFNRLWLPLKGIYIEKKTCIGKFSYTMSKLNKKMLGLTTDRFLSQWCHWHHCAQNRRFGSRFSSRIRIPFQKGFNPCIRCLGGVVWWKTPEVENLVSEPLLSEKKHDNCNKRNVSSYTRYQSECLVIHDFSNIILLCQ